MDKLHLGLRAAPPAAALARSASSRSSRSRPRHGSRDPGLENATREGDVSRVRGIVRASRGRNNRRARRRLKKEDARCIAAGEKRGVMVGVGPRGSERANFEKSSADVTIARCREMDRRRRARESLESSERGWVERPRTFGRNWLKPRIESLCPLKMVLTRLMTPSVSILRSG